MSIKERAVTAHGRGSGDIGRVVRLQGAERRAESRWREEELGLGQVLAKYPDISPFVIIKADVQRRGVIYTQAALGEVDPDRHMTKVRSDYCEKNDLAPVSLMLRDGTTIFTEGFMAGRHREPYVVDAASGRIVLTDEGRVIEEVSYWEKPDYYDKFTSRGTPMWQVVSARPQRLTIHPNQYCDFWKRKGQGCKFCVMAEIYNSTDKPPLLHVEDIIETVAEAVKEPGRNVNIFLTGGSLLGGDALLEEELDLYLKILTGISALFGGRKFPSQLISTAFSREQLRRLYDQTGLATYTADIEVLNKDLFMWICPGKASTFGYDGWMERLYQAVDIFGPGNVNTGIVAGVELARPKGFASEDEAIASDIAEAEKLARRGIAVVSCVWRALKGSVFQRQKPPSLEYYIRLAKGLDNIRRTHGISVDMDNYRRCGNHPDTDLGRI
ncbi:MAG: hypothetical protein LBQ10_00300 [Desulfovibrio sp.]|jgi:hypothetical protein|nr:hypothetical protein [Desulfovibrio sp.]